MPLSISRRESECIRLGDDISIRVTKLSGSYVTLAIDAPQDLKILRAELVSPSKNDLKGKLRMKLSNWF